VGTGVVCRAREACRYREKAAILNDSYEGVGG